MDPYICMSKPMNSYTYGQWPMVMNSNGQLLKCVAVLAQHGLAAESVLVWVFLVQASTMQLDLSVSRSRSRSISPTIVQSPSRSGSVSPTVVQSRSRSSSISPTVVEEESPIILPTIHSDDGQQESVTIHCTNAEQSEHQSCFETPPCTDASSATMHRVQDLSMHLQNP